MIIKEQKFSLFNDEKVKKPLYAHQKYILNYDDNYLKIHVPTSGGKTLSAVLFALKEKYDDSNLIIKTILTYPTNLLSKNQFESSIIKGMEEWVGAKEIIRGMLHPVKKVIEPHSWEDFSEMCGAPTIAFKLPSKLGKEKLWVSVLSGEILFNMFSEENRIELGTKKGKYLLNILETLMTKDHLLITSPDLLGYVAQQCYKVSSNFYNPRWKDELSVKFWEHDIVVDEYHFYDPYTYINLENTLKKLNAKRILLLSATQKGTHFKDAKILSVNDIEEEFSEYKIGERTASYPIEVNLVDDNLNIKTDVKFPTIYFFNSVVTAHEVANALREQKIKLTEWTGIEKSKDKLNNLIVATSAAEVGLDLPIQEIHTEFWGQDWEIPSLIQRIGRTGRFESKTKFRAFIYIKDAEQSNIIKDIANNETITKDEFTEILYKRYGSWAFNQEDYVSYYLWNGDLRNILKRKWQITQDRINFFFRPPQVQAVFDWNGHKFVYNRFIIESRYNIEQTKVITDLPFWNNMGLPEFEIKDKRSKIEWKKPYDGKIGTPPTKSRKWFIPKQQERIENII